MSYQSNCDCIHIWIKGLLQHYKQAFTTKKTSGVCGQHTSMEQQPWLHLNMVQVRTPAGCYVVTSIQFHMPGWSAHWQLYL